MTANSGTGPFPANPTPITFNLPTSQSRSTFLDTSQTTASFRLTLTTTTAITASAYTLVLNGSAQSFFDMLSVYSQGAVLEQIQSYNLLSNFLVNNTMNGMDKMNAGSISMGTEAYSSGQTTLYDNGTELSVAFGTAGTYYFNFTVPLLSGVVGILNTSQKLLPVGTLGTDSALQLVMQLASTLPISTFCTGVTVQPVISAITLDNFLINAHYVDIGSSSYDMLSQTLQDGKFFIKSTTYLNSNFAVPSGSSGTFQIPAAIRAQSLKSLFFYFSQNSNALAVSPNQNYDAICPALISASAIIGSDRKPQRPMNPLQNPAYAFTCLQEALGQKFIRGLTGSYSKWGYGATTAIITGTDNLYSIPASGNRNSLAVIQAPNMNFHGINCERLSSTLFSGVQTLASPPILECNFGSATTTALTCYFFGLLDQVIVIDTETHQISVRK
jgi:hypothetical protein